MIGWLSTIITERGVKTKGKKSKSAPASSLIPLEVVFLGLVFELSNSAKTEKRYRSQKLFLFFIEKEG